MEITSPGSNIRVFTGLLFTRTFLSETTVYTDFFSSYTIVAVLSVTFLFVARVISSLSLVPMTVLESFKSNI
jgi:hypothetical protein